MALARDETAGVDPETRTMIGVCLEQGTWLGEPVDDTPRDRSARWVAPRFAPGWPASCDVLATPTDGRLVSWEKAGPDPWGGGRYPLLPGTISAVLYVALLVT